MGRYALDMEKYADLARTASAEGCVLLKNDNSTLPLKKGDKVAVFGRMAFHYYKSGLGSGGLVNTRYVVGILDALRACKDIALDEELIGIYEKWIKDHPYDEGEGWGLVPWSQEEMPVTEEMLQTASGDDVALVILGRTAGEDQDNTDKPGSYKLTRRAILPLVTRDFFTIFGISSTHPQLRQCKSDQPRDERGNDALHDRLPAASRQRLEAFHIGLDLVHVFLDRLLLGGQNLHRGRQLMQRLVVCLQLVDPVRVRLAPRVQRGDLRLNPVFHFVLLSSGHSPVICIFTLRAHHPPLRHRCAAAYAPVRHTASTYSPTSSLSAL